MSRYKICPDLVSQQVGKRRNSAKTISAMKPEPHRPAAADIRSSGGVCRCGELN